MKMDGNIDRLPVWARNRIEHLERVVESKDERIAELSAGPDDSDTYADPYSKPGRALGKSTVVRFGSQDYDGGHSFDVQFKDGELDVRGGGLYNEEMVILPRVSNAFTVGFRPRS